MLVVRSALAIVAAVAVMAAMPWTLSAQPIAPDASFGVEGVIGEYTVHPGQTLQHKMTVSLGSAAATGLDILVDARGLTEGPDGATIATSPEEDTTPFSARSFISNIDHPTFHLEPGSAQLVIATIAVPEDTKSGMRYADIYIHTNPTGTTRVGYVLATHVPLLLTVGDATFTGSGQVTGLQVPPVESGKPIEANLNFKNNGDHHFKADADFTLLDGSGKQMRPRTCFRPDHPSCQVPSMFSAPDLASTTDSKACPSAPTRSKQKWSTLRATRWIQRGRRSR